MKVKKKYIIAAFELLEWVGAKDVKANKGVDAYTFNELLTLFRYNATQESSRGWLHTLWDKACELQTQDTQGSQDGLSDDDYKRIKKKADIAVRVSQIETLVNELKQLIND